MSESSLGRVVAGLRSAATFESACEPLYEALHALVTEALGPRGAEVVRVAVHLRDREGYHALASRAYGEVTPGQVAPSTAVWSTLAAARAAVAIDVGTCEGVVLRDASPVRMATPLTPSDVSASVMAMRARDVTHVIALPVHAPREGDALGGMVCIELAWNDGIARPWPRDAAHEELSLLVDVAGPFLLGLPVASVREPSLETSDPLFPIAGQRTRPLLRVLEQFAPQEETLLITGPTGVGKSRLAHWCHARSPRRDRAFCTANLIALPDATQLAELFGWKRGAFTGAHADHDGLVAQADGGTLFVDEIDKLSLAAQAGLLRLLETRRYSPLGASGERTANVRFIAATNGDLRALVRSGAFREDLFYRIHVLPVALPSLADRKDELVAWALELGKRRLGERPFELTTEGARELAQARWPSGAMWPGNLRQLDNVVRRAIALAGARGQDPTSSPIVLDKDHVHGALLPELHDQSVPDAGAEDALRGLAHRVLDAVLERRRHGAPIELDQLDVLRGAVLRAAVERFGSVKDAFIALGAQALVESRNHQASYKKELARLEALEALLDRSR